MENIRAVSPELQKKAEEELAETVEKMESNLKILRDWIKEQPHLHSVKPTDQFLISFLRGSKYNIAKCKSKIDTYYTVKGTIPEFYDNRDPFDEKVQEILKAGLFLPLKCSKEDSPKPLLTRFGSYAGGTKCSLADLVKVCLMVVEILLLEDDNFIISGEGSRFQIIGNLPLLVPERASNLITIRRMKLCRNIGKLKTQIMDSIVDLNGIGLRLMMQWTPFFARKVSTCTEKALSVRFKGMHILNAPYGIGGLVAIFKMVFISKIRDRIFVHGKDSLYDQIDKSVLPVEYGGTGGTVQELADFWKAKVESYRDWFLDENAMADESKRVKASGLFGWF